MTLLSGAADDNKDTHMFAVNHHQQCLASEPVNIAVHNTAARVESL